MGKKWIVEHVCSSPFRLVNCPRLYVEKETEEFAVVRCAGCDFFAWRNKR